MARGVVVIGGGVAGGKLVSGLRERGYDRPITLITDEVHLPYERPQLSKSVLMGTATPDSTLVADQEWYADDGVQLETGSSARIVDPSQSVVQVGPTSIRYEEPVIATGATPRHLAIADTSGANVYYLRTWMDAVLLRDALTKAPRVIMIGGSWIGLEVAAAVAAENIAGGDARFSQLPFFFSDQYDMGMEYVGHPGPSGFDQVVITGDPDNYHFRAWWLQDNVVVAGMHANDWDSIDTIRSYVGTVVNPSQLP